MNKPLYVIVGKSASGKDFLVSELCKLLNKKQVMSYTTRAKRYQDENTHYFISEEEFLKFKDEDKLVGYTYFNGAYYGATFNEVDQSDFYIVDPDGVLYFLNKYQTDRPIYIIYIHASYQARERRMAANRPNSLVENAERLTHDDVIFHPDFINEYADYIVDNEEDDKGITALTKLLLIIQSKELDIGEDIYFNVDIYDKTTEVSILVPTTRNYFKARWIKTLLKSCNPLSLNCKIWKPFQTIPEYRYIQYKLKISKVSMLKHYCILIGLNEILSNK